MATIKIQNKDGTWNYIKTVNENNNSHRHDNKNVIDKLSLNINNELTYDSNKIAYNSDVENLITSHDSDIATEEGKHGIRYFNDKLEIKVYGEWIEFKSGSEDIRLKFPVDKVEDLKIDSNTQIITLTWKEPKDFYINGLLLATWDGTRVVRKEGSFPQNENDGTVVVNNTVRNQYSENGFVDTGLIDGVTYYYSLFTYTTDGVFGEKVDIEGKAGKPKIYGVKIDTLNSNPETALTYIDGAVGFTSAKGNNGAFDYGSWEDKFPFNEIKPCLFKEGIVNYYLNPNDYTQKIDGSPSDITSGADGDVMVEFPKIYWKIEKVGTDIYVRYSDKQLDEGYKCLAHTRGLEERDKIFISAYLGYDLDGKLRSLSGKSVSPYITLEIARDKSRLNGENYEQFTFYQFLMLQVLFTVMFKNLNARNVLGTGYSYSGAKYTTSTGGSDKRGMFYGDNTGVYQIKFCGIEDVWGNLMCLLDGCITNSDYNILIGNDNYNNNGEGYLNYDDNSNSYLYGGFFSDVKANTEMGFLAKSTSGSATTYYCTYAQVGSLCTAFAGGAYNDTSGNIFQILLSGGTYQSWSNVTARLSYQ